MDVDNPRRRNRGLTFCHPANMLGTMSTRDDLLSEIAAFCAAQDMTIAEFGRQALNNASFVYKLRAGEDIRLSSIDKVRRFIREFKRPLARRTRRESRPAA